MSELEPTVADASPGRPLPSGLLALGYLLFAVAGVLAAVFVVLLIPFRIGATLIPIAPVLAIVAGVGLPALARGLTDSFASAVPPVLGQVLGTWVLSMGRPEGDVLMPAGSTAAVSYSVLILGTLVPLFVAGLASRPGPWTWSTVLGRVRSRGAGPAHEAAPGAGYAGSRRARPGSGNGGAR